MDSVSISVDVFGTGHPPLPAESARSIAAEIIGRMSIADLTTLLGDPSSRPYVEDVVRRAVRAILDGAEIADIDIDDGHLDVLITHGRG